LELVRVPAGEFLMGSDPAKDGDARDDEQPQHRVRVGKFHIGRYPVTVAQFRAFVKAASHPLGTRTQPCQDDHPAVRVSWPEAVASYQWLSQETGWPFRLPTEAEWEKAARGADGRSYPWGDDWDGVRCNARIRQVTSRTSPIRVDPYRKVDWAGDEGTTPVGRFSPAGDSQYGAADMAGNVREWCQSLYRPYPYQAGGGREDLEADGSRVARGGSWYDLSVFARCACRYSCRPDPSWGAGGFRVVLAPALPS
jgi:formylglycine-generating enzyme required for sulfatase activity